MRSTTRRGRPACRSSATPSLQERFDGSVLGRALISAFLLVTLTFVVVSNLPQSKVRRDALSVGGAYLNATGLDQSWDLFAPDPRRKSIALDARVVYADGSTRTWRPPRGGAAIGNYWDAHWQKWVEFGLDPGHANLWKPAAEFIARDSRGPGRRPVRVVLIRRTRVNNPPGHDPSRQPAVALPYYALSISPTMLEDR